MSAAWGRVLVATAALSLAPLAPAQVGMATLQVAEMPVTLLYPTAQASARTAMGPFEIEVARDAVPLPGVRRLVVLSHGTGGSPLADHALAATLVRAGFVVAQPLHQGDNHLDSARAGPDAWARRPAEVSRTLDTLAQHPQWQARLALDPRGRARHVGRRRDRARAGRRAMANTRPRAPLPGPARPPTSASASTGWPTPRPRPHAAPATTPPAACPNSCCRPT